MQDHISTHGRLWAIASESTRTGIAQGFITAEELLPSVCHAAHCQRGELHILEAHEIARDAVRHELQGLRLRAAGGEA
ncbi:hypothetical protein [Celeribacter sp.]|uniref:hypothetical protein n=1 Tax=Celeribacter sp. TaxID=1890673 RepID=UPI003A959BED